MKRLLLSLLLLTLALAFLSADIYRSNCLGQKLERRSSLTGKGYELTTGERTVLLLDGKTVWSKVELPDGYEKTEGDLTERVILEEGKPIRRILSAPDHREEYNYFYDGRLLSSCNYAVDGELVTRYDYLRTSDGRLVGYIQDTEDSYYLSPDYYIYTLDGETLLLTSTSLEEAEVISDKELQQNADGGYTETIGNISRTFDKQGRLVKVEDGVERTEYIYSDKGVLTLLRTTNAEGVVLTEYENGKAILSSEYTLDGTLKTTSRILEDGTIEETRYQNGVPRYRFHFDRDGKRIIGAEGL